MSEYQDYKVPGGGDGLYLKLKDGDSVKVRITSGAYVFNNVYQGSVSTRYAWLVFNRDESKAQVLQLGVVAFKDIVGLDKSEEWGDPTKYDIRIAREGEGKNTRYSITPVPNGKDLTKEEQAMVDELDITKLIKGAISLKDAVAGKEVPEPEGEVEGSKDDLNEIFPGAEEVSDDAPPFGD